MDGAYTVIFDVASERFPSGPWMLIPPVLTGVGALLVFRPAMMQRVMPGGLQGPARTLFSWVYFLFAASMTALMAVTTIANVSRVRSARATGRYQVAEGCLSAFHPMPASGHDLERLRVGGRCFAYSDYVEGAGFHRSESHGGSIHADSRVKLYYAGQDLLRIEVVEHACPAAPDDPRDCPLPD